MDAKQELKAKESKKKILGKRLIHDREDIGKIILDGNEDLVLDFKKIRENLAAFWAHLGTLKPRCNGFIPNTLGRNRDISLALRILTEKKRHYWFFSTLPDRGKSTFLRSVHDNFKADYYNKNELFQTIDSDIQFLLFDEYSIPFLRI